jgi:hypothetical protein
MLSRTFNFNGEILTEAVEKTFESRKTSLNLNTVIFDSSFMKSIQLLAGRTGQVSPRVGPRQVLVLIEEAV